VIATIRKETKQIGDLEEAGYRLPTWAVLRALLQIDSTTRIEGEAAICLPFLSFSVGSTRRSTLLGGGRRTNGSNMGESIRTRKGKLLKRGKHNARLGRVVQIKKRGKGNQFI